METKKSCETCEFYNSVCMGYGKRTDTGEYTYGMPIEEAIRMFLGGCSDWGNSLGTFYRRKQKINKLFKGGDYPKVFVNLQTDVR